MSILTQDCVNRNRPEKMFFSFFFLCQYFLVSIFGSWDFVTQDFFIDTRLCQYARMAKILGGFRPKGENFLDFFGVEGNAGACGIFRA